MVDQDSIQSAFDAARNGDLISLQAALQAGVGANSCNDAGDSLLMLASYRGQHDCAAYLAEQGADPNLCNRKGQHPLAGAAFHGASDMVRLLLQAGAEVEGNPHSARSPLMYAAAYNHAEVVAMLLHAGANSERLSPEGKTALQLARDMRAVYAIECLEQSIVEPKCDD